MSNPIKVVFKIRPMPLASREASPRRTWASIGLFRASLFADIVPGTRLALRPKLEEAITQHALRARPGDGPWVDVGTMERLASLQDATP